MAEDDPDGDEEWFKEVYGKQYTGPSCSSRRGEKISAKRALANDSDNEEMIRDPNAVPTDFTSREAKVWEAKAKAIERNWKRRKEEELYCKLCGESGHFAQGCPTTLGANRKFGEVVERLPLKDKRLKPRLIGTGGSVIQGLEKDTGCRLRLEDNHTAGGQGAFFVRISGPDRATVCKAVNIVKKLVNQVEDEWKNSRKSSSFRNRPNSNISEQLEGVHCFQNGGSARQQQWEDDPLNPPGRRKPLQQEYYQDNYRSRYEDVPETLDELERGFVQEALELSKEQSAEEDREISRHHECLHDIREQYQQKLTNLTTKQARRREDFLQFRHHHHEAGYGSYEGGYHAALNQHASYEYAVHHRKPYGGRSYEANYRHF